MPECSSSSHINMYLCALFLIALIRLELNPRDFYNSETLIPSAPSLQPLSEGLIQLSYLSRYVETKTKGPFSCGNFHWFEERAFMKISCLTS